MKMMCQSYWWGAWEEIGLELFSVTCIFVWIWITQRIVPTRSDQFLITSRYYSNNMEVWKNIYQLTKVWYHTLTNTTTVPDLLNKYQINMGFSYFRWIGVLSGVNILAPYQIDIVKLSGFSHGKIIFIWYWFLFYQLIMIWEYRNNIYWYLNFYMKLLGFKCY